MRKLAGFWVIGLLFFNLGCGPAGPAKPKLYPVSGKVTVAGKPLADCGIQFVLIGKNGVSYNSKIAADGSFTLEDPQDQSRGAQAGKYKVVLLNAPEADMKAMMAGSQSGQPTAGEGAPFPAEYSAAATSPNEYEVKAESNTIDIVIP